LENLRSVTCRAARLGAVALHIEYDGLLNPIGYKFVPTEYVRIIKGHPDEIIEDYNGYAVYNNWDRRKCSRVKTEDIKYFIKFTNDKEALKKSIKKLGGFSKFKGCVYFSTGNAYPLPKIDSVIGDVAGEDSISTIKCRNARSNFLPSSMVIEKGGQMYSNYINLKAGSKKEEDYSDYDRRLISYMDNVLENNSNRWKDFQGDENALKMMIWIKCLNIPRLQCKRIFISVLICLLRSAVLILRVN
jgi:hypothetical protein